MTHRFFYALYLSLILIAGCNNPNVTNDEEIVDRRERRYHHMDKFFGEEALLFTTEDRSSGTEVGIGVNSYLWQASLDTLSFMPLRSVDPFGGVILTEWYRSQEKSSEQLKVDVRILTRQLRTDGIKVSVFRQEYKNGQWINAKVSPKTARDLEDAILTRAQQLKINAGK